MSRLGTFRPKTVSRVGGAWCALVTLAVVGWSAEGHDRFGGILVASAAVLGLLVLGAVWTDSLREAGRSTRPGWILPGATAVLVVLTAATAWPLRVNFALSRGALDRAADAVAAGAPPGGTFWAGGVRVLRPELRNGVPCLWTSLDPSGYGGFLRCGEDDARRKFNAWSACALSDDWTLLHED